MVAMWEESSDRKVLLKLGKSAFSLFLGCEIMLVIIRDRINIQICFLNHFIPKDIRLCFVLGKNNVSEKERCV